MHITDVSTTPLVNIHDWHKLIKITNTSKKIKNVCWCRETTKIDMLESESTILGNLLIVNEREKLSDKPKTYSSLTTFKGI